MKMQLVFILALGLSAYASTTMDNTNIVDVIESEKSEPGTTEEINLDISDGDNLDNESYNSGTNVASVDIVIEKKVETPLNLLDAEEAPEFDLDQMLPAGEGDFHYTDVINRDPNEIMDTAAGFVPIPILKRKKQSQRRYAIRRNYQKPYYYRRFQGFYPYYYGFYRPSSLRYYYY